MNLANQSADIEFGENDDGICVGKRRNNFGTLLRWHHRTTVALERAY
jgi:hypothetical protein